MQIVSNTAISLAALCVITLTQTNSVCSHGQIYCILWLAGCKQKTHKGFKASQSSLVLSYIYCWKEHTKYVNISTHYEQREQWTALIAAALGEQLGVQSFAYTYLSHGY